jgi:hypothetical protein
MGQFLDDPAGALDRGGMPPQLCTEQRSLRAEESIASLCRAAFAAAHLYYRWSKEL